MSFYTWTYHVIPITHDFLLAGFKKWILYPLLWLILTLVRTRSIKTLGLQVLVTGHLRTDETEEIDDKRYPMISSIHV